ncbi:lysozyme [Streptomyces sp. NPDC045456]|uniref:lysozyme n=1 Tax=Streptomyces sp. NPDC045456 TaxID=3155254 RepID=UPI00340FD4FC
MARDRDRPSGPQQPSHHPSDAQHPPDTPPPPRRPRSGRHRLAAGALALGTLTGVLSTALPTAPAAEAAGKPAGHDVSSHQGSVDWKSVRAKGGRFVYVKATESTWYRNPHFPRQYRGARKAGLLHGAYHFGVPNASSGRAQARYFLRHGGRWKADGWTLPPALDLEHNPYDREHACYGMSGTALVRWVRGFSNEVLRQTGRRPVIYTTARWWNGCTGGSRAFAATHPLWLARWHSTPGTLPAGWLYPSIWQHAGSGALPGDQDKWNGTVTGLRRFARG